MPAHPRSSRALLVFAAALAAAGPAWAGLTFSTDNRPLVFGVMDIGEERELVQGGAYHNQLTCSSTNGRAWYLKVSLLTPMTSGSDALPADAMQWQVVRASGTGTVPYLHQWHPFSLQPETVYLGSADEAAGRPVQIELKYQLNIPEIQVSGSYQATIRFTLTEVL